MSFNSFTFAVFFVIVFFLYLSLNHKRQNILILLASYVFYGYWDWRFLSLIIISTVVDYFCGINIPKASERKKKRALLLISVVVNLSLLGFFKYFSFFAGSLQAILQSLGLNVHPHTFNIILPVGISFYTFQTMSYTIDIYYDKCKPTKKFIEFAAFVAFFPQLVAGPIERARRFLPQFLSPRKLSLEKFYEGCYLIYWGLFLKVFIADNLAVMVDSVFASQGPVGGARVLVAAYAFAFQIYCDFAGYSNIARGLGKCMGFDIMLNFNLPLFATNPVDFWRRWHISLSTWLRDYLYIPLGGNREGRAKTYRNLLITMVLGGLWHGAAWTFVLWGVYHAALLIFYRMVKPVLQHLGEPRSNFMKNIWFLLRVAFFFNVMGLSWLIFRAESMEQFMSMLSALLTNFAFSQDMLYMICRLLAYIGVLLVVMIFQFRTNDLNFMLKKHWAVRTVFYALTFYLLLVFGATNEKVFIYFQF